jgi:cold shock CspA family protein
MMVKTMGGRGLTKIGVFYDGNYFLHVSNYYKYSHERKSRLSVAGLHRFLRSHAAFLCDTDDHLCHIVDAHYFRGRVNAFESRNAENGSEILYYERLFDDMLHAEGITTHYLPVRIEQDGSKHEKGIDVLLALEAFELAFYKRFDILVIIASDGDYVPLVRKLNALGIRVMVLSWDFEYVNSAGKNSITRTSQALLEEAAYPVAMHEIIDNRIKRNDPIINGLFTATRENAEHIKGAFADAKPQTPTSFVGGQENASAPRPSIAEPLTSATFEPSLKVSTIKAVKDSFGFINNEPQDAFFHCSSVIGCDFSQLQVGDTIEFLETFNDGKYVAKDVKPVEPNGNIA